MTRTIEELTAPITGWWITYDGENYMDGPITTRDEAIIEATTLDAAGVARCTQNVIRVSDLFCSRTFLEQAEDDNDEWHGEDGQQVLDFTNEQIMDLQASVRKAIDEWQVRHQLAPVPYMFSDVDEFEIVED